SGGISVVGRLTAVSFAVDLDGRADCAGDCSPESRVGNAARVAANHSSSQRAATEKRAGWSAAILRRAGVVLFAHRAAIVARRPRVVSLCARSNAISLSGLGLLGCNDDFHDRPWEDLLPNGRVSDADGRSRRGIRTNSPEPPLKK